MFGISSLKSILLMALYTNPAVMGDDDVAALVVDNGSGMCKAGFAGDDAPPCRVS